MNNKVLVTVTSNQKSPDGETEEIQTIQVGNYRRVAGKHVITYEEMLEASDNGNAAVVSNILKVDDRRLTLTKKGDASAQMNFEEGLIHKFAYETGFGTMQMSMHTSSLSIDVAKDSLDITVEYGLEINCIHMSDNRIHINVVSNE